MSAGFGLISASVGARGANRRGEVVLVQHVFNRAGVGGVALKEDDVVGPLTIGRIREYQAKVLRFPQPDGVVDPSGPTLRSLLERIAMQRPKTSAPPHKPAAPKPMPPKTPVNGGSGAGAVARPVAHGAAPAASGAARRADRAVAVALPGAIRAQAATPRVTVPSGVSGNKLTEQDFIDAAASLGPGIEAALVHAVADVESGGKSGFNAAGLPVIAFEGHRFRKLTKGIYDRTHPLLSYPYVTNAGWQWQKNNSGQVNAWATLNKALALNHDAALLSCSWGMFQVMGDNHAKCGYADVNAFVAAMKMGEKGQLQAFVSYCKKTAGMVNALKKKDFAGIAQAYNGNDVAVYAAKFKRAYAKYKG